jgi:hypothetical protein
MNKVIIRNILLAVLLLVFLLVVLLFRGKVPFGKSQGSFASEPSRGITRIELSQSGNKLALIKKGQEWTVNNDREARKSAVMYIIRILTEMKIKSPVSGELFNNEITHKDIVPVKVKVYEGRKLLKSFLVFKTGSNIYGNIMKLSESASPFIVNLPGYEGEIGSAFTLNELYWQPFMVFNLLPSEIASIDLQCFADTSSSFTILHKGDHYLLSGSGKMLSGWDTSRVKRYISYFARIPFEKWAFEVTDSSYKRVEMNNPVYILKVRSSDSKEVVLSIWDMYQGESGMKDYDRVYGKTENRRDLFIMRYFDIDPVLKKRSYFFTE